MPTKLPSAPLSPQQKAFFQQFYEEYSGFLYFSANKYTQDADEREDIVQDSLLRLLCNTPTLMTLNHPKRVKYIALTVRSAYLDRQRLNLQCHHVDLDDSTLEALLEKDQLLCHADAQQTHMVIAQLKDALSPRDWLILEGKYILGYSQEELAKLAGVTPDSIRMLLHRARIHARSILLNESDTGGDHHG